MSYAVIGTFYRKHENTLLLVKRLLIDSTRKPDEAFFMCEGIEDVTAVNDAFDVLYEHEMIDRWPDWAQIRLCPTPKEGDHYTEIPYSRKINEALDLCKSENVVYLDNGSIPTDDKYEIMADALDANPSWGAVYCTQRRTGMSDELSKALEPVEDGYCKLNYTQVMHRKTEDRWPLSMEYANPDMADGVFWRKLHASVGVFFPVGGENVLDVHHIPHPAAEGC